MLQPASGMLHDSMFFGLASAASQPGTMAIVACILSQASCFCCALAVMTFCDFIALHAFRMCARHQCCCAFLLRRHTCPCLYLAVVFHRALRTRALRIVACRRSAACTLSGACCILRICRRQQFIRDLFLHRCCAMACQNSCICQTLRFRTMAIVIVADSRAVACALSFLDCHAVMAS